MPKASASGPRLRPEPSVRPRRSQPTTRSFLRTLQSLQRERRRLGLAAAAIVLGVGYLAGTLTVLNRVGRGLDELSSADIEPADLFIDGPIAYESPFEQVRQLIPASLAETVASDPDVRSVQPRLDDNAVIVVDGNPMVSPRVAEQPRGSNWPDNAALNPYTTRQGSRAPNGPTEVVIDDGSADRGNVRIGDSIVVATKSTAATYTVVGVVELDVSDHDVGSLALFDTSTARTLFERTVDDSYLAIDVRDGADLAAVAQRLQSAVAPQEVSDADGFRAHREATLSRGFTIIRALLTVFTLLAVVVGTFTVANSMALLFAQRRRSFALLRLNGASPGQLTAASLTESAILGLGASIVAVPLGVGIAWVVERILQRLGTTLPSAGSLIDVRSLLAAVVVGTATTVATTVIPARQTANVSPLVALDEFATSPPPSTARWPVRVARLLVVCGLAMAAGTLFWGALAGLLTAATVVVLGGVGMLVAWLLARALRVAAGLLAGPRAAVRAMATSADRHSRTRLGATTGALGMAAAVVTALVVIAASFVSSISGEVDETVSADLVVDSGTFGRGGIPASLIADLAAEPGVAAISGWRLGRVEAAGLPMRVSAMTLAALSQLIHVEGDVDLSATTPESIVITEQFAQRSGIANGDILDVVFPNGAVRQMPVDGVIDGSNVLIGDGIIDTSVLAAEIPSSIDVAAFVALDDPAAAAAVRDAASEVGVASVVEPSEFVDRRAELLRGFQGIIEWMLLFSVLLAVLGVANTLSLSIAERRRELGLFRLVGASRQQVARVVLAEAGAVSTVGTAIGVGIGVATGWGVSRALRQFGLNEIAIPIGRLGVVAGTTLLLGVVMAILPVARATAIPPIEALSDDTSRSPNRVPRRGASGAQSSRVARAPALRQRLATQPQPAPLPATASRSTVRGQPAARRRNKSAVIAGAVIANGTHSGSYNADWAFEREDGKRAAAMSANGARSRSIDGGVIKGSSGTTASLGGTDDRGDRDPGERTSDSSEQTETFVTLCYHCGREPGGSAECQWCGASHHEEVVNMFSITPELRDHDDKHAGDDGVNRAEWPEGSDPIKRADSNGVAHSMNDNTESTARAAHRIDELDRPLRPTHIDADPISFTTAEGPLNEASWIKPESIVDAAIVDESPDPPGAEWSANEQSARNHERAASTAKSSPFSADERHDVLTSAATETAPATPEGSPDGQPTWRAVRDTPLERDELAAPPDIDPPLSVPHHQDGAFEPIRDPWNQVPVDSHPGAGPTKVAAAMIVEAEPPPSTPPADSAERPPDQGDIAEQTLVAAYERLGQRSQTAARASVAAALVELGRDEEVHHLVAGTRDGSDATVVVTDTRVIVVDIPRLRPRVERFLVRPSLEIRGRHVDRGASIALRDGDRYVAVDAIDDVEIAVELVKAVRARAADDSF